MKNLKLSRNLWLVAGFCFLLSFILNLTENKSTLMSILNGFTCVLSFINAYITDKKITNNNDDKD